MKDFYEKLSRVQAKLVAPKNQYNKFGGYAYRSLEDIQEAVKPLLASEGLVLIICDEIVDVAGRIYVKATATLSDGQSTICNTAFAREEETKKGMDASQITGSASSYARKYALNGLFIIDDCKDADTNEQRQQTQQEPQEQPKPKAAKAKKPQAETCTVCGAPIIDTEYNGQPYNAEQIVAISKKKRGVVMCIACALNGGNNK